MPSELQQAYQLIKNKLKDSDSWKGDFSLTSKHSSTHQDFLKSVLLSEVGDQSIHYQRLHDEFFSAGPITNLLADEDINEIMINQYNNIWVERNGKTTLLKEQFLSLQSYQNFIDRILEESEKSIDLQTPYIDGTWQGFRLHLVIPPLTLEQPCLTLRRHKIQAWNLEKLAQQHWTEPAMITNLRTAVQQHKNILIIGTTSSGKTSCLNALINSIGPKERVVSIEDSSEIQTPNALSIKLLTRTSSSGSLEPVDQTTLLRQALRMNPDRIIMGEVRGNEAKDLLLALSTGHQGSLCTLHAHDPQQALWRLEMLVQMGAPQWSLLTIRRLIQTCIDLIISVEKSGDGRRRLKAVHQICSLEESGFIVEPCFGHAEEGLF